MIWDHFEKLLTNQRETGQTVVDANAFLLLFRHGFFEETYFSWKFVPIIGDEGRVVGSHATVVEVTREVISDRRLSAVRALSRELSQSQNIRDLWNQLILGIGRADKDIPLALLYSVEDTSKASRALSKSPPHDSAPGSTLLTLEGSIGISAGHSIAPANINLDNDEYFLAPFLRESLGDMSPVVLPVDEKVQKLLEGIDWRGFGVPSTNMVVCPIIPFNSGEVLTFLIIALNPRRPYDDDYSSFVHLLTQQVTTPQLSAVILREEVEKRQLLAKQEALDRARLYRELSESETRFARFATRAPIRLAILTPTGDTLSANDLWRDLTQLEVGSQRAQWDHALVQGEADPVNQAWSRMIGSRNAVTIQTRINRP